jgi:hypothetical protein
MEARIGRIEVKFEFNPPVEETGFLKEGFDSVAKPAYATPGIAEIIERSTPIQPVVSEIFRIFRERAKHSSLDYLQKLSLDGEKVWCIDDGNSVCLLTPAEY